ncbi:MAG: dicarboxylate/amino acid:cation symporter, partial [Gammaproteobacteria bacterium]
MWFLRLKLHWQILIALLLAAIAGSVTGSNGSLFGVRFLDVYEFIGTLFINALKMLIVPLIFSAIITGISNIGDQKGFGRLGLKTIAYYLTTSFIAIVIGLVLVNLIQPGHGMQLPADLSMEQAAKVEDKGAGDIVDVFLRMVPPNVVQAAAQGQMLGIIFFSLLFGFFMTRIREDLAQQQINFWQGVFEVMMRITDLIMRFAPIGVFGLVAAVVAKTGLDQFGNVLVFFFTVLAALMIHLLIILPLILKFVGGVKPFRHYRAMAPALLTAFSTSSSSATLPITLDCVENNAGVSNRTTSFVLPLGATVNMDGTALYECVAA